MAFSLERKSHFFFARFAPLCALCSLFYRVSRLCVKIFFVPLWFSALPLLYFDICPIFFLAAIFIAGIPVYLLDS